jgi:hypothetical protein
MHLWVLRSLGKEGRSPVFHSSQREFSFSPEQREKRGVGRGSSYHTFPLGAYALIYITIEMFWNISYEYTLSFFMRIIIITIIGIFYSCIA